MWGYQNKADRALVEAVKMDSKFRIILTLLVLAVMLVILLVIPMFVLRR
jgi:hypothetical protein